MIVPTFPVLLTNQFLFNISLHVKIVKRHLQCLFGSLLGVVHIGGGSPFSKQPDQENPEQECSAVCVLDDSRSNHIDNED